MRSDLKFSPLVFFLVFFSIVLCVAVPPVISRAALDSITLSTEESFSTPRWVFNGGDLPKGSSVEAQMAKVKKAQLDGDNELCLKTADLVRGKIKSLQGWLAVVEADCALGLKSAIPNANRLAKILDRIDQNPSWLLKGPQAELLRKKTIESLLVLADWDLKSNRARCWKSLGRLRESMSWLDEKQRARMWRLQGELAFIEQKIDAAKDFFTRSLNEVDDSEVRARFSTLDSAKAPKESVAIEKSADVTNESSEEELELVDRVTAAMKSGDLVAAVTDAVKIITGFPGSTRAKWASDRVSESYWSFADKTDPKFQLLKDQILKQMLLADADRLSDWSRTMYNRAQFADSYTIGKRALESISGSRATALLDLVAKAALASDNFDGARELFDRLKNQHSGTQAAREAFLRSGLLYYRQGQYTQAVSDFEKVNSFPESESIQVVSRYWMWRSLQRIKSEKASLAADELMRLFPFSYYGLRARLEVSGNVLDWKSDKKKAESKIWLAGPERLAYEKARLLVKAGWLDEAQVELRELPAPARAEDKAVRALLLASAGAFTSANRLVNEAWDENSEFRSSPFVNAAFPREFEPLILTHSTQRKVDRYLIQGLIKQESGYHLRATSSANAMGLMQMIPSTARELAADLKITPFDPSRDLFKPAANIQMGTYYVSRLINKYQGSVPLGLAAYNAGQGRIDRWLRLRPSLKDVSKLRSKHPDDELWIDELPYWETSFYVKAILRNLVIYRMLDKGKIEVQIPVWTSGN